MSFLQLVLDDDLVPSCFSLIENYGPGRRMAVYYVHQPNEDKVTILKVKSFLAL